MVHDGTADVVFMSWFPGLGRDHRCCPDLPSPYVAGQSREREPGRHPDHPGGRQGLDANPETHLISHGSDHAGSQDRGSHKPDRRFAEDWLWLTQTIRPLCLQADNASLISLTEPLYLELCSPCPGVISKLNTAPVKVSEAKIGWVSLARYACFVKSH